MSLNALRVVDEERSAVGVDGRVEVVDRHTLHLAEQIVGYHRSLHFDTRGGHHDVDAAVGDMHSGHISVDEVDG